MHKSHGFTLMEILVTLVIVAIVTGLSLPLISQSQRKYRIKTFLEHINTQMLSAQTQAIQTQSAITLRFDPQAKQIIFISPTSQNIITLPPHLHSDSQPIQITFFPDGTFDDHSIPLHDHHQSLLLIFDPKSGCTMVPQSESHQP